MVERPDSLYLTQLLSWFQPGVPVVVAEVPRSRVSASQRESVAVTNVNAVCSPLFVHRQCRNNRWWNCVILWPSDMERSSALCTCLYFVTHVTSAHVISFQILVIWPLFPSH